LEVKEIMNGLNKNNKRNAKVTTEMTFATLVTIVLVLLLALNMTINPAAALLSSTRQAGYTVLDPEVPSVVTGDNIYMAWWTNNTQENGNEEAIFRASNDGGATFSNRTNLSNTTEADSWRVEIAGEGENVVVSWWETNQTSDVPVARVSNDGGETFGPLMMLGLNGTLGSGEAEAVGGGGEGEGEAEGEEEPSAEGVIEEAAGGTELAE
jgi:hypothetical protein